MGMQKQIEDLLQDRVFEIFYGISQIPRQSFHEEQISRYLVEWAQKRGLFVVRDKHNNVLIRKAASKAMEKEEGLILQAHMDMVCEKALASTHDFSKDPIPWNIEGDYLTTGGETTLGADDGIGMALAMALLEEEGEYPLLEVLLTTAEEEDLSGAAGFDTSLLQGTRMINLDNAKDNEILCGSCGGEAVEVKIPLNREEKKEGWKLFELCITGLKGGHSGEDIHRGHGNANKFLARVLLELEKVTELKIARIKGGTFRLAIPREASLVLALPQDKEEEAREKCGQVYKNLKEEYLSAAEKLEIKMCPYNGQITEVHDAEKIIHMIMFSPDNIFEMNSDMENLVSSSDNMGELYLTDGMLHIVYEIRAARNSARDYIAQVIERLAEMMGGSSQVHSAYPGWDYHANSVLRKFAVKVFIEQNGQKPISRCVHAGLECGCFFETMPELDAISIGPNCEGLHSPQEKLSISSTKKMYKILKKIIEEVYK